MAKIYNNPGPVCFTAEIQCSDNSPNSWAWVKFPLDLKTAYGVGNLVPVVVNFDNKVTYRGSLSKMGGETAQIVIRKDIRAKLNKNPGDLVEVKVELDDKPREIDVANDVRSTLESAQLWEDFMKLAYSHRKEYITWIEGAKKSSTRASRIQKTCEMLAKAK